MSKVPNDETINRAGMTFIDKMFRDNAINWFYEGAHGELENPDDPITSGPFVVGNWYKTDGGRWVKMVGIANMGKPYETIIDHLGHNRYSQPDQGYLCGRCTGTKNSSPDNIDILGQIKAFREKHPNF